MCEDKLLLLLLPFFREQSCSPSSCSGKREVLRRSAVSYQLDGGINMERWSTIGLFFPVFCFYF